MTEAHITIGVVPRERFSAAPEALRRLLQNTPQPFELLIVDAGTPEPWRSDIEQILAYRSDATVVPAPADTGPLLPNQARNLVLEHATGDWICLLENDVLVGEDWLNPLLTNAERHGAGAAVPLILERFDRFEKVHFDDRLHRIIEVRTSSGIKRRIEARPDCKEDDRGGDTRIVDFIETHCMLFTTDALDQVGGFDGEITAQEEIDISFGLHAAGITAVFVPQSTVTFLPPPPVYPSERAYYHAKWNPETYQNDRRRMQERWGIVGYPSATGVVESRRAMAEGSIQDQIQAELDQRSFLDATREDLAPLLDRGRLILVHDDQLDLTHICPGADVVPFLERDGIWWGPPADSSQALEELDRMQADGATTIVFSSGSWWWLDTYDDFDRLLRDTFPLLASTDRIKAFDLMNSLKPGGCRLVGTGNR